MISLTTSYRPIRSVSSDIPFTELAAVTHDVMSYLRAERNSFSQTKNTQPAATATSVKTGIRQCLTDQLCGYMCVIVSMCVCVCVGSRLCFS